MEIINNVKYGMINDLKNWRLTLCDNLGPINNSIDYTIEFTPKKKKFSHIITAITKGPSFFLYCMNHLDEPYNHSKPICM
ncbi:hypothetical protein BpHYR1_007039 [Brachionus plicatilis]|uniref:Uncharacterized protein n=1 Tax=Brachionus plicatilis TaxID=10195 RepID=A0A3M7SKE7_BRAPC|nr:hypothetical protein BpHYR1_007039 [Brachionus plicatilis]